MNTDRYTGYTPVDFLKDEGFLRWQLLRHEEDTLFWNDLVQENPELIPVIGAAVTLYKDNVKFNDFKLTSAEIFESLDLFHDVIDRKKKRKQTYKLLYISAAACIAALAVFVPFLLQKKNTVQDITTFVQTLPETDFHASDTRLILSDNNTITLRNRESSVQYGTDVVTADDNLIPKAETSSYNQLITPYGKRSTIAFSDGTKVWVNAGSKLVYPPQFDKEKREIYVDGEIYLEVAPDKSRPFVVKTKKMDVRVLGTKFNVSSYEVDHTSSVALLSGSVGISSQADKKMFLLKPDQLYTNTNGVPSVKHVDASRYALWIQGVYRFESEPLLDIIKRLERYYGAKINCSDKVAQLKCSGKLDLKDDLNVLLKDLTRALTIDYRQDSDGHYSIN